jgi:hypothetical protein
VGLLACRQDAELQAIASALFECRQTHHTPKSVLLRSPAVSVPLGGFWFAAQSATESSSQVPLVLCIQSETGLGTESISKRPILPQLATGSREDCWTTLCFVAHVRTTSSALMITGWLALPATKADAGKALRGSHNRMYCYLAAKRLRR